MTVWLGLSGLSPVRLRGNLLAHVMLGRQFMLDD